MGTAVKASGQIWIGDVPTSWKLLRLGSLFKCRNVKVDDTEYPPLSVSKGGIVPQIETVAKTDANDNRKQVLDGDFVINSRSDRKQSCGLSSLNGSVSLINIVLCQTTKLLYPQYVGYLLKNYGFAEEFYRWGHGIVADLWTTRWQEMSRIVIPVPPLDEQQRIAKLLDSKTQAVDSLIENERQQISNLGELRQAKIREAVTRGLDVSAPQKDTGDRFVGTIPLDWEMVKFKRLATLCNGREVEHDGGPIPVYGSGGVFKYTDKALFSGVSLLTGRKGSIDNPMLVDGDFWPVDTMFYTSEIKGIDPKYLFYSFKGSVNFDFYKSGSVLPSMTQSDINNISLPVPGERTQKLIVSYLDHLTDRVDSLIALKEEKVQALIDYRASLIYEYVTGKREA
jgi:type I restriction enzyme, S subunit